MPHIHEKIDFTVEVFIVFRGRVLLRKHDKYDTWLSVGGHIDLGEDPTEAAVREVKEEVGLDIEIWDGNRMRVENSDTYAELIPPYAMNRHRISDSHEHVTMTYFANTDSDKINVTYESDKSEEWGWFNKNEIKNMDLLENIRDYANKSLELLSKQI